MIIPMVTVSSIQRSAKPLYENQVVCVIKNSEPLFYTVSPDRYAQLLDIEKKMKELQK